MATAGQRLATVWKSSSNLDRTLSIGGALLCADGARKEHQAWSQHRHTWSEERLQLTQMKEFFFANAVVVLCMDYIQAAIGQQRLNLSKIRPFYSATILGGLVYTVYKSRSEDNDQS